MDTKWYFYMCLSYISQRTCQYQRWCHRAGWIHAAQRGATEAFAAGAPVFDDFYSDLVFLTLQCSCKAAKYKRIVIRSLGITPYLISENSRSQRLLVWLGGPWNQAELWKQEKAAAQRKFEDACQDLCVSGVNRKGTPSDLYLCVRT